MISKNKIENTNNYNWLHYSAILILRVVIGYHFLYEGMSKFIADSWSAKVFLAHSNWVFAKTFQLLADSSSFLSIIDFLNIWGQIFIGLGLILGLFIKYVAYAGALLLLLYYVAYPPFVINNVFVDRNLIEFIGLILVASFPVYMIGLDELLSKRGS